MTCGLFIVERVPPVLLSTEVGQFLIRALPTRRSTSL
jgi:hypothetical protein